MYRCKTFILLVLSLTTFPLTIFAQSEELSDVYAYLHAELNSASETKCAQIAKKNNQWQVFVFEIDKPNQGQLFPLDLKSQNKLPDKILDANLTKYNAYDERMLGLYENYGYPGYFLDNIKAYSSRRELSDDELYALGRNYSALYANFAGNSYAGGVLEELTFQNPSKLPGNLSINQLAILDSVFQLCIQSFEKLYVRNPNYKTYIGSIETKLGNEYLYHYMTLNMLHSESEAVLRLKKDLYSVHQRNFGANILECCPKNSILITGGDIDTYLCLYMQKVYGLRTDVAIICDALIGSTNYVRSINYHKVLALNFINDRTSPIEYLKTTESKEPLKLKDWLKIVKRDDLDAFFELPRKVYLNDSFLLVLPDTIFAKNIHYLDIYNSYFGDRPICSSGQVLALKEMQSFYAPRALVFHLKNKELDLVNDKDQILNINEECIRKLQHKLGTPFLSSDVMYKRYYGHAYQIMIALYEMYDEDDKLKDFIESTEPIYKFYGFSY